MPETDQIQAAILQHTWDTPQGKVTLDYDGSKINFFLLKDEEQVAIPLHNIRGLCDLSAAKNKVQALDKFLENTYIKVAESSDNYSIDINQRIFGGANIINPVTQKSRLWPGAVVPFEIDTTTFPVGEKERPIILQAIAEWNAANTGFVLVPRTNEENYLVFGEAENVCNSHVGYQGGRQYIRCDLDGLGFNKRSIKHEIGHAIGFYHEHQRFDRDNFVQVNSTEQVNYGKQGMQYGDYDLNSVMHYHFGGSSALIEKPGVIQSGANSVGQQEALSAGDIAAAKYLASFAKNVHVPTTRTTSTAGPAAASQRMFKPSVHQMLSHRARQAYQQQNFAEAMKCYAALINEYLSVASPETRANWCFHYGYCALSLENLTEAKKGFNMTLKFNPNATGAQQNLALIQQLEQTTSQTSCQLV